MENRKIRIGITHGDINGVGYELILRTFEDEGMFDLCVPIVYGSPKVATYHRKALESTTNFTVINSPGDAREGKLYMINCFGDSDLKVEFGQPTEESGRAALVALQRALKDCQDGLIDALVTCPLDIVSVRSTGEDFPGQTEYIEKQQGDNIFAIQVIAKDNLRIACATSHVPVQKIADTLNKDMLKERILTFRDSLERDFGINGPRIAVLSLNPKGVDGTGSEENEVIEPAIFEAGNDGTVCFGPYPVDEFFGKGLYVQFDGILAMYHDQAFAPFKSLVDEGGVSFTAGVQIVRTAPLLGTEYLIAGQGKVNLQSMRDAIYTAVDIFRNRTRDDEAYRHPLEKQYYEKKDDSYKLKLDQPDDGE